ncbi:MAG: cell division protein FtsQ/DivIB [Pseudomonadota bacterium]|nr:cell division protein FtsQ/DivIB [Pseudomonadota bacterium]
MSAAQAKRGGRGRSRETPAKASMSKSIAKKLPIGQARANRWAGLAFGLFLLAIAAVVIVALEIPSKAATQAGQAIGRAGFAVDGYQIVGLNRMDRRIVDQVVNEELSRVSGGLGKPAQPLVDVSAIRDRLMQFGWVKDARVSRRLPDTLVIDIVERQPAALWQDKQQLALIDANGVVLDRVPVTRMPDLPLLIGPEANLHNDELGRLMASAPTLKPQLASATWMGRRRWDLSFQSGETIVLPEGEQPAQAALARFAKMDRSTGLLGRGLVRFDLRIPGKMIVRLPRAPGETIAVEQTVES